MPHNMDMSNTFKRRKNVKKKTIGIILAISIVFAMLYFVVFGILKCEIDVEHSPNGDYQVVSYWIDKGGLGYSGAFYVKEKGLFSKWHKLGTVPFSGEWISNTQFAVHHSYVVDDDYYKEYNVNDYFDK